MPAGPKTGREFHPLKLGGPLNEANTPAQVGSDGLTACKNVMYRRFGAWGKRPGSSLAGVAAAQGNFPHAPSSAYRFYAAFPAILTQTIVAAQGALWKAGNLGGASFTKIADFIAGNTTPVDFCTARDPAAQNGAGADVLIIAGASLANASFATGSFTFTSATGTPISQGQTVTVTLTPVSGSPVTLTYVTLATDNVQSIASQIVTLINDSAAVTPSTPFLSMAIESSASVNVATIMLGALVGGSAGNGIGIGISTTGTGLTVARSGATLSGGGGAWYGPLKWDGTTLSALSPYISNAFTGCVSWHNHVWYWGDPKNPLTVFASDINEPEGWSFMTQEGGYDIGDGTGGQQVTALAPIGNILYAFNSQASYAITGYDFQSGEYEFQIAPAISDSGTPYKDCVAVLKNAIIYWSGVEWLRLVPGAFDTEKISSPIPYTAGQVSMGNASLMRSVAGSFQIRSQFGTTFTPLPTVAQSAYTLANVALFACDVGSGVADTVLVYDDKASRLMQYPAWSSWSGWVVDCWLQLGSGTSATGGVDTPTLFFIPPPGSADFAVYWVGGSATTDSSAGISFNAQTGWFDCGTPQLAKLAHRIFLDIEARAGVQLYGTLIAAGPFDGTQVITYTPFAFTWPPTVGQGANETSQQLIATINPALRGYRFMLIIQDFGSSTQYEILGAALDYTLEALTP